MTKVQEAIEVLQNLPAEKARMFADVIIDAATPRTEDIQLSDGKSQKSSVVLQTKIQNSSPLPKPRRAYKR